MIMQKESPPRRRRFGHSHAWLAFVLLLFLQISVPATAQPVAPEMDPDSNKSVATIMGIVALMFLVSGFLSLYSGKCTERQAGRLTLAHTVGGSGRQPENETCNGLNQEVIDTFPTFLYSNVKGLKIGKGTLACAVCLNEFQDDETLRLIPICSHVYHHSCIDLWLASHSTCPVCRASLLPTPNDTIDLPPSTVSIPMPEEEEEDSPNEEQERDSENDQKSDYSNKEPLRRCRTMSSHSQNRPIRSRSTGFLSSLLSPAGRHSVLVQPGEDCERFTLRLPDEVRSQMLSSTALKRAKSCVNFTRMSSGTWGYRTRSVGRFGSDQEQWGCSLTPPNFVRSGWNWNRSVKKSPGRCSRVALDNEAGERSSDFLCPP